MKKVILCKITLDLKFLPIQNRRWWKKCCGNRWGWSEIGHENGSHGAVTDFQQLSSAQRHLAFMGSLTSDFVCGGRQDTKGGTAFCRFLCNFSLDLQMSEFKIWNCKNLVYWGEAQYDARRCSISSVSFKGPSLPTVLHCAVLPLHNWLFQKKASCLSTPYTFLLLLVFWKHWSSLLIL